MLFTVEEKKGTSMRLYLLPALLVSVLALSSCGSGQSSSSINEGESTSPSPEADIAVLMMGNSHTAANGLPALLETLLRNNQPTQSIMVERIPASGFLIDHADSSSTLDNVASGKWTHVVLQGQKYSQSFQIEYPITGALTLIEAAQNAKALPIMFPEWAQINAPQETDYIHNIHENIALQTGACVAPIGYAWEHALTINPEITLHANDGNHAVLAGSFLTALVIYETITGHAAELTVPDTSFDISESQQIFLGQMASYAVANHPACEYNN